MQFLFRNLKDWQPLVLDADCFNTYYQENICVLFALKLVLQHMKWKIILPSRASEAIIEVLWLPSWWDPKQQGITRHELPDFISSPNHRAFNLFLKNTLLNKLWSFSKLPIAEHLWENLLKINLALNSLYLAFKFTLTLANPPPAVSGKCLAKQMGLAAHPKSQQTWALFN